MCFAGGCACSASGGCVAPLPVTLRLAVALQSPDLGALKRNARMDPNTQKWVHSSKNGCVELVLIETTAGRFG